MQNKKRIFLSFSIILAVTIFMLIVCILKKDQLAFNHYVKEFTQNTLSQNALDLHYTLKEPSNYGIYDAAPLPVYESGAALNTYSELYQNLLALEKIDISSLSDNQSFTYEVLRDYLEEHLELEKYPYFAEPLTPNSGVHTTLPILLAEYQFYDTGDIDTYFEILATLPSYFEGLIQYETEKADAGFFMNSTALNKVVTACENFVKTDNISSHLLSTTFKERLESFSSENKNLSSEEMTAYLKQNETLLKNSVLPAYVTLASELTLLSPHCNEDYHGLCSFQNGKGYYLALLKRNIGSYRSISDIKELLFADFEENYNSLIKLLAQNPQLLESGQLECFNKQFPLQDNGEILEHLQLAVKEDFPPLFADPSVIVKSLQGSLTDYCAPAFYLTVPLDAYENNVIYVNEKNALSGLDLYTTLAHEGFPGHLYQTVFFHQANSQKHLSDTNVANPLGLLRNTLYYGGYTEGYAMYVEALSYDYALALCENANLTDAQIMCNTLKHEWQMQISLYCLLDIAIHYDGASYEQIKALLNKFGIIDDTSVNTVYQYLLNEPTTYLKYYLGLLEIQNLKQQAKNLWGQNYSDLKFHTFLLKSGPCSFDLLTKKIMEE